MKIIVPLAGKGTRLLPLTRRVPKPLVKVAGRPVMDYVMDTVKGFEVEELIVITGHLKEDVERYIRSHYPIPPRFIEQRTLDGTAGAFIVTVAIRENRGRPQGRSSEAEYDQVAAGLAHGARLPRPT